MFITTHYMEEADEFCDRIAFIHQGRIELVGTAAELKATLGAQATLDDVFKKFTGAEIESGGNYRDVRRTRRSVREHV
jgi:ABC-2 type transport system ATP-binding protein